MGTRSAHIFDIPRHHPEGRASASGKRLRASHRESDPVQLPMRPSALHIVLAAIIGVSLGFAGLLVADEVSQIRLKPTPALESAAPSWTISPEFDRATLVSAKVSLARAEYSAGDAAPGIVAGSQSPEQGTVGDLPSSAASPPPIPSSAAQSAETQRRSQNLGSDRDAALPLERGDETAARHELGPGVPQGFDYNPY